MTRTGRRIGSVACAVIALAATMLGSGYYAGLIGGVSLAASFVLLPPRWWVRRYGGAPTLG